MIGDKAKNTPISAYQPSDAVIEITKRVKDDYSEGVRILYNNYVELNDRSIIEDANRGQRMFNAYVDESIEDVNEAWKWRGTRSMARNKGIAMHAQLTSNYLIPLFEAQNFDDEEDRAFSEVMQDLVEWMAQPVNSNYQSAYLQATFGMMYNPVTYLSAEFFDVYQTIKEKLETGGFVTKEVRDEVLSGFKANVWGPTEILITNAYERNIQRQSAIIKRRPASYGELEAKYCDHPNWAYVQSGIKSIYNDKDGLFYDVRDDETRSNLVTEETWLHRRDDLEIPFVNGIYMGEEDVEANLIKHRDNLNRPKYNVTPFGYMRINEHFFYFKSMMNALAWDDAAYDAMSEIVYNRAILENEMPVAITGVDQVDSSVVFPNSVVSLTDPNSKVSPLLPQSNIVAGFNALREVEKSMSEGSVSEVLAGQLPDASQKAFNVAQAQANARRNIGSIGKSLAESIVQFGDLMKDIIVNHYTIPQIEELTNGRLSMQYKSFLLKDKQNGAKMGDRLIKFDKELIGAKMTDEEKMKKQLAMLEETGYPEKSKSIRLINPEMFARFKYLTKVDVEAMFSKNQEYWQPILMAIKQQFAQDPFIDQEQLTRKIMYSVFNSEGESLMKDDVERIPGVPNIGPVKSIPAPGAEVSRQMNAQMVRQPTQVI